MLPLLFRFLRFLLAPQLYFFCRKLRDPKRTQEQLLSELCFDLSKCNYGKTLNVSAKDQYESFSSKVPIISYDEVARLIAQHMTSGTPVLTTHEVIMFERTSGSSGPVKYIPYTRQLLSSFTHMFSLWCCDLLRYGPRLMSGKIFMSISPSLGKQDVSKNGKRIGTNDDLDYVNGWISILLRRFLVLPANVQKIKDYHTYRFIISLYLLSEANLEIISIWNPSFLEVILSFIGDHRVELIKTLHAGKIEAADCVFQFRQLQPDRIKLLEEPDINWSSLWPHLKLISCWSSANAHVGSKRLHSYFPNALIQGKGLLATEAPLTIPLLQFGQYVPLIDDVFFEFEANDGVVIPLWQVEKGLRYSLIISQKGGLYRYKLGDQVFVTGFANNTPCFDFVGRNACSDLVGEKLHEDFVTSSLESLSTFSDSVNILVPMLPTEGKARYILLCENSFQPLEEAARSLDEVLRASFHYSHARDLDQLAAPQISIQKDISLKYLSSAHKRGMSLGNIKTPSLITNLVEARNFLESINFMPSTLINIDTLT